MRGATLSREHNGKVGSFLLLVFFCFTRSKSILIGACVYLCVYEFSSFIIQSHYLR